MHRFLSNVEPVPSYFYLDWSTRTASWRSLDRAPKQEGLKFSELVKWKQLDNVSINLCSNYHQPCMEYTYMDNPYSNVAFLKSHLQKSIRRSDVVRTLKTTYLLMDLDLLVLLRRLSVIALEDTLPIHGYSVLVWFCAAVSKGYRLSEAQQAWVLGYAYQLARIQWRDRSDHAIKDKAPVFLPKRYSYQHLDWWHYDLVYSIAFRRSYGGRGNDCKLFDHMARVWQQRPISKTLLKRLHQPVPLICPPLDGMPPNQWLSAAIDHHCYPNIVYNLQEHYDQYDEEAIKQAIWDCSGSVNHKRLIKEATPEPTPSSQSIEVWHTIRQRYHSLAKYAIRTRAGGIMPS